MKLLSQSDFLRQITMFDIDNINEKIINDLENYLNNPEMSE